MTSTSAARARCAPVVLLEELVFLTFHGSSPKPKEQLVKWGVATDAEAGQESWEEMLHEKLSNISMVVKPDNYSKKTGILQTRMLACGMIV